MKKQTIWILCVILCSMGLLIYFEFQKKGFHEDEVYSISSSVSEIWNQGLLKKNNESEEPKWFTKEQMKNFVTFTSQSNVIDVYKNQVADVHPPLFYIITFLVSAILPNFTMQNIFIINLIFFLLIQVLLICILKEIKKEKAILPTLLLYDFSVALINTVTFQRMYTMLTFFALSYLYLTIKLFHQDFVLKKKDILFYILVTVGGFLTQYFFVIYAILLFLMSSLYMFKNKKYKELRNYFFLHILCAGIGLILFPASISHILFGGRGIGSMGNTGYLSRLLTFLNIFDHNFNLPLWLLIPLFIWYFYQKKGKEKEMSFLLFPSILYFFIMVQIVPFLEIRYIMLIMPIFAMLTSIFLLNCFQEKMTLFLCILISIVGLYLHEPNFLYKPYQEEIDISNTYQNNPAIFVTDNTFTYLKNIKEFLNYSKSMIININEGELKVFDQNICNEKCILRLESYLNSEEILNTLEKKNYQVEKELLNNEAGKVFLITKEKNPS